MGATDIRVDAEHGERSRGGYKGRGDRDFREKENTRRGRIGDQAHFRCMLCEERVQSPLLNQCEKRRRELRFVWLQGVEEQDASFVRRPG
jgi:hypothetical protein